jgi:prepilin-type N-terminal cleavage/methylation domain-containing protein
MIDDAAMASFLVPSTQNSTRLSGLSWLRQHDFRGFTLIELLVTVAIMATLSSLVMSGLLVARQSQRRAKTTSTIRKLSEIILPYYENYETRRPSLPSFTSLQSNQYRELRRIALRRLMTLELPERALDVPPPPDPNERFGSLVWQGKNLSEVPPAARRYRAIMAAAQATTVDSAELLHMIVMRGPVADPGVIAHFRPDEMGDIDNDRLPEFLDGWNRPIQFLRWPVGFASVLQPINGDLADIDDMVSEKGHRLVPLIYSAGPDESYDIEQLPDLNYFAGAYDPFKYVAAPSEKLPARGIMNSLGPDPDRDKVPGAVWLEPINNAGRTTFRAHRRGADGLPSMWFQCVGSERDIDGDGVIGSSDNIHNHDLTR